MPQAVQKDKWSEFLKLPADRQRLIINEILRSNFPSFVKKVYHTVSPHEAYQYNWHIDAICDYLDAVQKGEIRRLIINIPPRFMKSIIVSIAFPAWLLAKDPTSRIICASYGSTLAEQFSIDTRKVIQSSWFASVFSDTILSADQNNKRKIQTTAGGYRVATSVGGSITGEGGNFLLFDDLVKPDEALSEATRNSTNTWLDQTFLSRGDNPKTTAIVGVAQRLHEDDPCGHLIAKGGWEVLSLPIQFTKKTIISTPSLVYECEKGEYLHPDRFGPVEVAEKIRDLGEYAFTAQYMQNPVPLDGGLFKKSKFRTYTSEDKPHGFDVIIHSWDTAHYTKDNLNDFTACTVWGVKRNGYYLLQIINARMEEFLIEKKIKELAERDNPRFILIENKSSGISLIGRLKHTTLLPIIPINIKSSDSKLVRAGSASVVVEQGKVYIPADGGQVVEDYLQQLSTFPNARNDDMVDSTSMALNWIEKNIDNLLRHSLYDDDNYFYTNDPVSRGANRTTGY